MRQRIMLRAPSTLWAFMLLLALGLLAAAHAPATSEPLADYVGMRIRMRINEVFLANESQEQK